MTNLQPSANLQVRVSKEKGDRVRAVAKRYGYKNLQSFLEDAIDTFIEAIEEPKKGEKDGT